MSILLAIFFVFCGAFVGVCAMAWACAAKNADDHWNSYEAGYRSGIDHMAQLMEAENPQWPSLGMN